MQITADLRLVANRKTTIPVFSCTRTLDLQIHPEDPTKQYHHQNSQSQVWNNIGKRLPHSIPCRLTLFEGQWTRLHTLRKTHQRDANQSSNHLLFVQCNTPAPYFPIFIPCRQSAVIYSLHPSQIPHQSAAIQLSLFAHSTFST